MIINLYNYKNDINKYSVETDIFEYPKFYRKHNVLLLNRILYEDEILEEYSDFYHDISNKGNGIYLKKTSDKIYNLNGNYFFAMNPYTFTTNYFHFTFQSIAPILLAFKMDLLHQSDKIIIDSMFSFQKDLFTLICKFLNIQLEIFTPQNGVVYNIENCIFSEFMFRPNFHRCVIDSFEDIAIDLLSKSNKFPQNIYITRKDSRIRKIINEDEVISMISKKGYRVINNSHLSIKDQILLYKSAKNIVAPHGAGLTNIAYTVENITVTECFSENRYPNVYINLCSKKDCTYSATVNKASRLGYPDATYTIDIKLLERALEEPICKFSKNA